MPRGATVSVKGGTKRAWRKRRHVSASQAPRFPLCRCRGRLASCTTAWELHTFEQAFIKSEVRATHELAAGLRQYLQHLARQSGENVLDAELACCERDVMIIDRNYLVVSASKPERLGTTWKEPGIEAVLRGSTDLVYNDHEHDGHRVIDVSVAIEGENGTTDYVLPCSAGRRTCFKGSSGRHRRDALLLLVAAFGLMALLVSVFTNRMILRPLEQIRGRIGVSPWGAALGSRSTPDLQALHHTVNAMLERIEEDRTSLEEAGGGEVRAAAPGAGDEASIGGGGRAGHIRLEGSGGRACCERSATQRSGS